MAMVKRLADYALSGGSGGYKMEGMRGVTPQALNEYVNQRLASTPGGNAPQDINQRREIDRSVNKMLGIQTAPGVIGAQTGISGRPWTISTPKIAQKAQMLQNTKEAKELDAEKRELEKLTAAGDIYNSMLKSADNPTALKALKESEEFKMAEKNLKDSLGRVFSARSRDKYVTPKGDLRKMPKQNDEVFDQSTGAKYTFKGITMENGQPKFILVDKHGREYVGNPEDVDTKKPSGTVKHPPGTTNTGKIPIIK